MGIVRAVHAWAGMAIGAVVCVLGLSGSVLVFLPELERLHRPELYHVRPEGKPAPIGELRELSAKAAPSLDLYRIKLPHQLETSWEFIYGHDGRLSSRVYVDQYQRRILGVRAPDSDFLLLLQSLHFDLLGRDTGRRINGMVAFGVLAISFSGLTLWLRSTSRWTARMRPRWRARPARRNWGFHVATGWWSAPFLAIMATTAIYFAFHLPVTALVHAITRTKPILPPRVTAGQSQAVSPDEMLLNARKLEPQARFTVIRLPRADGQTIVLNYVLPGDLSELGANVIHVHPRTGEALRNDRIRDLDLGHRFLAAFVPIHFGTFGGMTTRILWTALGLMPTVLFTTGIHLWRRRRKQRGNAVASNTRTSKPTVEVINT